MLRQVSMYSGINKISSFDPKQKLLISLIPLLCSAYTKKYEIIVFNIFVIMALCAISRVNFKLLMRFISISFLFCVCSSIPLIFEEKYDYIVLLFFRAINGAISIGFLSLTTPINHIIYIVGKVKHLEDIADVAKSLDVFLIIVEKDFEITLKAIESRSTNLNYIRKIKNIGKVCAIVFKNLMYRWKEINDGLNNRCYNGKFNYYYEFKKSYKLYIFSCIYIIINLLLFFYI